MHDLHYHEVVERLLDVIPEIRPSFDEEAKKWDSRRPHPDIVFGTLFSNLIAEKVRCQLNGFDETKEIVKRAFSLLEELSASSDFKTRCLAEVSVLESLLGDEGGVQLYIPFMGLRTRKLAEELVHRWHIER